MWFYQTVDLTFIREVIVIVLVHPVDNNAPWREYNDVGKTTLMEELETKYKKDDTHGETN